ncbi:MAG: hypothetical protein WDM92_08575 [Caulobacteraceae bacterium]
MNKAPGLAHEARMRLQSLPLSLSLAKTYEGPNKRRRIAYEPLLLEAMNGGHHPVRAPRRGRAGVGPGSTGSPTPGSRRA